MRRRRFAVAAAAVLLAPFRMLAAGGVSLGQAPASAEATPYDLNVKFTGLVGFVPEDRRGQPDTARQLWALLPNAVEPRATRRLEPRIRNYAQFQAGTSSEHAPHFPFLRVRAADLAGLLPSGQGNASVYVALSAADPLRPDPKSPGSYDIYIETPAMTKGRVGLFEFSLVQPVADDSGSTAHACKCLSRDAPADVNGTAIPLVARIVFESGEEARARRHSVPAPLAASGDHARSAPPHMAHDVTVTRRGVSGATTIRLRRLGTQTDALVLSLRPRASADVEVEIVNLTAQELLGMPHEPPPPTVQGYPHFKLAYLIAPKPDTATGVYVWNYATYKAPDGDRSGDPFCTPPSQLLPPDP